VSTGRMINIHSLLINLFNKVQFMKYLQFLLSFDEFLSICIYFI